MRSALLKSLIKKRLGSAPDLSVSGPTRDWRTMPPSFVIDFAALLLFGPIVAVSVSVAGTLIRAWSARSGALTWRRGLAAAPGALGLVAAGWAHTAAGGSTRTFDWPWEAVAIAVAAAAYSVVVSAIADVAVPLVRRTAINRSWGTRLLQAAPTYAIGASLAAALAALISQEAWELLPVALVPLSLVYLIYRDYLRRIEHEYRGREVVASLTEGMCVIDGGGHVTLWSDALERIMECPRERAIGRTLQGAIPAVAETEIPRAVKEALATRKTRTLAHVGMSMPDGPRMMQVTILPVSDGVTLLWQDVTDHARAEHALRRREERLALAAEGASDGLWEWDLRTQEFYVTGRWRAMIGLPGLAGITRPEEWLDRVHADDIVGLKEALEAHLSGHTPHLEQEHRVRHEDGTYRVFVCRGLASRRPGRRPSRIAGSLTDSTDRAITQERLRNAVFLDPLTGLYNRAIFVEGLGRRLQAFKQRRGTDRFAVLYLDLDRFKVVNDSLGHLVGDELLIAVSRRLESCLRQGDTLARLGGDEFAILLNGLNTEQQANVIAFRVQEALSKPFLIGGREVFTSASIGIAFGLAQYNSPDEIMHDADTAMYHAKARGKARHEVFDADMDARVRDRLGLENDLRRAVNANDFEMHYQPIVSLATGMCVGFESLVRWKRNGEPISPATFIPIAEELGLIEALGTWVLKEACETFARWQRQFPDAGLEYVTVNVSSRQLMQQNFLSIVEQTVYEAGLQPNDLRIEITETALMASPNVAAEVLTQLRAFGAKIYLDDFGTGYSSLSHLHKLPVDTLKIDRSFVRSLLLPDRPAIVESILALARTLNTSVVAEGIETEVQARELERLGCTHAQGFLFSRPVAMPAAEEILAARLPLGPKQAPVAAGAVRAGEPELVYRRARVI